LSHRSGWNEDGEGKMHAGTIDQCERSRKTGKEEDAIAWKEFTERRCGTLRIISDRRRRSVNLGAVESITRHRDQGSKGYLARESSYLYS